MSEKRLQTLGALLGLGLLSCLTPEVAHAQATWPQEIYNPASAEGLLYLPLPCGGRIGFRRVVTDSVDPNSPTGPLSDLPITMGRPIDRSRGFIETRRPEYIAGSLSDTSTGERFYLVGAYEITVAQYKAVMEGPETCPAAPERRDVLPVTDVSWYDAIAFTRRLNQWIYAGTTNQLASLSQLGVDNGFIRLPTEAEWEFAARGGLSADEARRNEPLFFAEGSLDDYAWYNGATSSGGKVKPVGGKKPNPLGLYDVYGNAEEIVLEPFRMTRTGRLHGGIGGFVTRGGSFLDQPETITSARRDERPFFDVQLNGEFKRRTQGFRVAVSTSAVPADLAQMSRLETASQEIQRQVPGDIADQPTRQLARAAEQVQDAGLRAEIENLNTRLATEFARRNELEAVNLQSTILNATITTRELYLNLRGQRNLQDAASNAIDDAERQSYRDDIEIEKADFSMFLSAYSRSIAGIANSAPDVTAAQIRNVKLALRQQSQTSLLKFVDLLESNIASYKRDGRPQAIVENIRRAVNRQQ